MAVLVPPFRLEMLDPLSMADALQYLHHLLGTVRRHEHLGRPADDLGCRVAVYPFGARVPARDDAIRRLADDRSIRRKKDRREHPRRAVIMPRCRHRGAGMAA